MALKFEVESLDTVDEAFRSLYTEQNGKFVLGVEGVVPKTKLEEFRTTNVDLKRQLEDVNKKFKDIDPELYAQLTSEHQKIKDKQLIDAGKIDELVEERVKQLRTTLEGQTTEYKTKYEGTRTRLEKVLIDNEVSRFAVEAGCVDTALDDIVLRARTMFRLNDQDQAVAMEGDKVIYGADGLTPLSVKDWMAGLVKKAPHLFKQSSGGGAGGSNKGGGTGGTFRTKADFKTPEQKSQYITDNGMQAYLALPAK